jgi:hypothetical protein
MDGRKLLTFSILCGVVLTGGGTARPAEPEPAKAAAPREAAPITQRIDAEIQKKLDEAKVSVSPLADDAEFLRRAYLDLTGKIPPAAKVAAFLDSKEPDKRARLIDELLESSDYGRHFGIVWSDLIVKRDEENRTLRTSSFKSWLAESFNQNRGWDKIVQDLLNAEGSTDSVPQTLFFMANRDMDRISQAKVVGTATSLFLGIQMQCAECHKHPFVRSWKQEDFWGMAAFFSQTRLSGTARPGQTTGLTVSESSSSSSGRRPGGFGSRGPSTRGAQIEIPDPIDPRRSTGRIVKAKYFEGEEPSLGDRAPFRPNFATWLTAAENKYFAQSSVNRLWNHFFGRGFINPLDDYNDDNLASHPELLAALATEFRASGFDLKHLIRAICNSQTYQRTSRPLDSNEADEILFSHQKVKVMSPEVLWDSLLLAMETSEPRASSSGQRFGGGGFRGGPQNPRDSFVNFFSTKEVDGDPGEMGHGVPQFLRLMNSAQLNRGGPVVERLATEGAKPEAVIEGLFLATLSRRPTPAELQTFTSYTAKRENSKDAYAGVLWVLLNSGEFMCVR